MFEIIDIGGSQMTNRLRNVLDKKIISKDSQNRYFLPDTFFSDDAGLQLWQEIVCLPDYYQCRDEIELLNTWGPEIETFIPHNCTIIDLGCGLVFTAIIL
jgi:uncharacterized SAM-dependent methyltransferase